MSGTRAGARLLSLSRHLAHAPASGRLAPHRFAALRVMSTVQNETGAAAPAATDAAKAAPGQEPKVVYNFPVSEVPKNPLGEGRYIKTAAALIIGYVLCGSGAFIVLTGC